MVVLDGVGGVHAGTVLGQAAHVVERVAVRRRQLMVGMVVLVTELVRVQRLTGPGWVDWVRAAGALVVIVGRCAVRAAVEAKVGRCGRSGGSGRSAGRLGTVDAVSDDDCGEVYWMSGVMK